MTTFVNGGVANNYPGLEFTNTASLLSAIASTLTLEGWTTITSSPLRMKGVNSNNDNCWFRFTTADFPSLVNGKQLQVEGDVDGTGNTFSPLFFLLYVENGSNRLWMTADNDSFALSLLSSNGGQSGIHAGFEENIDPSDRFNWGIGQIDYRYNTAYKAKNFVSTEVWHRLSDSYPDSENVGVPSATAPFQGTFDSHTICIKPHVSYDTANVLNAGYKAYNGQVNGVDDQPILDVFYRIEGQSPNPSYLSPGTDAAVPMYPRGIIKHCVQGMSSLNQGEKKTVDGKVYMSVGGLGWQGMRIA